MYKTRIFILTVLILLFFSNRGWTQSTSEYDKAMVSLSKEVAQRVKSKNKIKVAIWNFTDTFGKNSALGDYIGRDFSIHFTNASNGFDVVDRDHLSQLFQEHQLNTEGFINPATAKKIGMLIAGDAIITGTVDVGLHHLRIRIKILNTETGLQIAAALKNLPIDENMKIILQETGFYNSTFIKTKQRIKNGETEDNPRSTNTNCEALNTGNYCFENKSNTSYQIEITKTQSYNSNRIKRTSILPSGGEACFENLPAGNYRYLIYDSRIAGQMRMSWDETWGTFKVEKCKALKYNVR